MPRGPPPAAEAPPAPAPPSTEVPAPIVRVRPVASPYAREPDAASAAAAARLAGWIRGPILEDPENGWALAHALLAWGPDLEGPDGRPVVDLVVGGLARPVAGGIALPRKSPGGRPLEPHEALVLKTVTEIGLSPSHAVVTIEGPRTLADLWRGELGGAWVDGAAMSFSSWRDTPWLLQAAATWAPEGLTWRAEGHAMDLRAFTHAAVGQLVADTAFLSEARAAGTDFAKRGQGIFGHPCGGSHFLQGVATAVALGFGAPEDLAVLKDQAGLHLWRFDRELAILDAAALRAPPEYALLLDVQRLKFAGHHLEAVHRLAALGLLEPGDPKVEESLVRGRAELVRAVEALAASGAYDRLPAVRAEREQTYLDLLGDGAHALHGLALDAGGATVLR